MHSMHLNTLPQICQCPAEISIENTCNELCDALENLPEWFTQYYN